MFQGEDQLMYTLANAIASGGPASTVEMVMKAGHAGQVMRRRINSTISAFDATPMMMVAARPDDDESVKVAKTLQKFGAEVDWQDTAIGSCPLFIAADFGKAKFLRWLIEQGAKIDRGTRISTTLPVYTSCQNNHLECVAALCKAAMDQGKLETLNARSQTGKTPGYVSLERGFVECMGALAQAGADLRRVFAVYWVPASQASMENAPTVDPGKGWQPQSSLMQALISFTTLQCAQCLVIQPNLSQCAQCRMAQYCSRECQKKNWKFHKHCCKRLRKGEDLISKDADSLPDPLNEQYGFEIPFSGKDFESGDEDGPDDDRPVWEYNAGTRGKPLWKRYPIYVEESLESMIHIGGVRYMYRPGNIKAEGRYEAGGFSPQGPPPNFATNYVYFKDMLEREVYTGAIRAVRRNGERSTAGVESAW